MSCSDWSSDDGVSDSEDVTSALNTHLVTLLTQPHQSRVTRRRRSASTDSISDVDAPLTEKRPLAQEDETPRRPQPRIDLTSLLRSALQKYADSASYRAADVDNLSRQIAEALRKSAAGGDMARAVTHAVADPLNTDLRESLWSGALSPVALVGLDEVRLLNPKKRAKQEQSRLERLNQHSVEYLEKLSLTKTNMFTCPACGSNECFANFRSTDFVKWQGDDQTPTLLRCCKCSHSFRQ